LCTVIFNINSLAHIFIFLFIVMTVGCQSVDSPQLELTPLPKLNASEHRVTLAPGDEIEVKFFYVPELNEIQKVRPDGKITLQLVGEVVAQKKTPLELKNELINLYESELKKPEIAVIVRSLSNQRVYVGGEVFTPGMIELPGSITVLEAIILAGGFNMETANLKKIVVIRNKDGQQHKEFLDYHKALEDPEDVPVFNLQPLDIVYVPSKTIIKINQWVDQYINKIIPFGTTVTGTIGTTTVGIDAGND
jgi:polysaccharide biosynthesis/export protein